MNVLPSTYYTDFQSLILCNLSPSLISSQIGHYPPRVNTHSLIHTQYRNLPLRVYWRFSTEQTNTPRYLHLRKSHISYTGSDFAEQICFLFYSVLFACMHMCVCLWMCAFLQVRVWVHVFTHVSVCGDWGRLTLAAVLVTFCFLDKN